MSWKIILKDFAKTSFSWSTDLIEGVFDCEKYYDYNPTCDFCWHTLKFWEEEDKIRVVKREWCWDHNEYRCICVNCIEKFYEVIKLNDN